MGMVVKDVCTKFRYVYPDSKKKRRTMLRKPFVLHGVDDEMGVIYADNGPDLEFAVKKLGVRRNTSREYSDENQSVIRA